MPISNAQLSLQEEEHQQMADATTNVKSQEMQDVSIEKASIMRNSLNDPTVRNGLNDPTMRNGLDNSTMMQHLPAVDTSSLLLTTEHGWIRRLEEDWSKYPTTLSLVVLLHVIFFHQWNKRQTRSKMSYRQLVHRKQFHRALLPLLSHAPLGAPLPPVAHNDDSNSNNNNGPFIGTEEDDYSFSPLFANQPQQRSSSCLRLATMTKTAVLSCLHLNGPLAGLPLLTLESHLLWQCRALEETYNVEYRGVLMALTFVILLLEIFIFHWASRFTMTVLDKNLSTSLLGTISALLLVYIHHFPHIPISPIPFFHLEMLTKIPPIWSWISVYVLLLGLSIRSESLLALLLGVPTALFWNGGILTFFAQDYWNRCFIAITVVACSCSIQAQGTTNNNTSNTTDWLPWIDYVAWNEQGVVVVTSSDRSLLLSAQRITEQEDSNTRHSDLESQRQHRSSSSWTSESPADYNEERISDPTLLLANGSNFDHGLSRRTAGGTGGRS